MTDTEMECITGIVDTLRLTRETIEAHSKVHESLIRLVENLGARVRKLEDQPTAIRAKDAAESATPNVAAIGPLVWPPRGPHPQNGPIIPAAPIIYRDTILNPDGHSLTDAEITRARELVDLGLLVLSPPNEDDPA